MRILKEVSPEYCVLVSSGLEARCLPAELDDSWRRRSRQRRQCGREKLHKLAIFMVTGDRVPGSRVRPG